MTYDEQAVSAAYDRLSGRWDRWAAGVSPPLTPRYLAELMPRLAPGGRVLEMGCGTGIPVAAELVAAGFAYTGVDLSPGMVAAAGYNVPGGDFRVANMAALEMEPGSLDAVVAFYSIFHLPRAEHAGLFRRVAAWLRPGGWFVFSMGAGDDPAGTEDDWLGAGPMFWSNHVAEATIGLVLEAGFEVVSSVVHGQMELGDVPVRFLWVVARRPEHAA